MRCRILFLALIIILTGSLPSESGGSTTCEDWVARIVSVQGSVHVKRTGETQWEPVEYNNTFCMSDMLRVQERSRAAIVLSNDTILRLDQNTTITFTEVDKKRPSLIEVLKGVVHFFSRTPATLKVITPFVNAAVEGTEFLINVNDDRTVVTVFEGQVKAENRAGSLTLASGQSAEAGKGQAPVFRVVVRPRGAVQWALYYPPILYRTVDLSEEVRDPGFFNYRAMVLLSSGRVDEAHEDIKRSLDVAPENSHALSLQSIIAVVQNDRERARSLALKAVEKAPESAAARIALSYAQQANFELEKALAGLREAVKMDPENSLAWARLSELWLSFGRLDKALEAAEKAVELDPGLAHTQTVLGFAYLMQIRIQESVKAFGTAIGLDQSAPLPRLGLGLAKIREGRLKEGRREIEIAASLDPNNSLIRSYLGKSFYEEKRDSLAKNQFEMAKRLDPLDPTPFFYSAIQKQTLNRPVEALHDLQKSIELNENRSVYRSRLLLDEDLAARSASLARTYSDLGFQQLALIEGWKSVNIDPGNHSAHRFLADSYSVLPRHEIARVSELLQSQLLQPVSITPVQPRLAEGGLFILNGSGPGDLSFNEFNPLFNRNRLALQISGVAGGNSTSGDELVLSALHDRVSISLGQYHYETDGFRDNNDLKQDIYNVFAQANLSHKTSILAEFRATETEKGDLPLRFDQDDFTSDLRKYQDTRSIRGGLRHTFSPHSDIIATVIYKDLEETVNQTAVTETDLSPLAILTTTSDVEIPLDYDGYLAEVQHLFRTERFKIAGGIGYFEGDRRLAVETENSYSPEWVATLLGLPERVSSVTDDYLHHTNFYLYSYVKYPDNMTWTLGGSIDLFEGGLLDKTEVDPNPKLGLTWNLLPSTTFRAALFRVYKRTLISSQTLEPTQVAGFNQFFDDGEGTEAWRYGAAIDHKVSADLYGGIEYSERDLETLLLDTTIQPAEVRNFNWYEKLGRAYLYWTPHKMLATSIEYQYERFERDPENSGEERIIILNTHRIPLGINFYHPSGFSAGLKTEYIKQEGTFGFISVPIADDRDDFWVTGASVGYRFPKRRGVISIEARNLFNDSFGYQDMDAANPSVYPERLIFAKFTLAL